MPTRRLLLLLLILTIGIATIASLAPGNQWSSHYEEIHARSNLFFDIVIKILACLSLIKYLFHEQSNG